jgi:tRNA pseudouridine38-40 synthase
LFKFAIENTNLHILRYFIQFSYDGSQYFGYQIQPQQISVQAQLQKCLSTLLRQEIQITGAGRTDTGVHASQMFAHFDVETPVPKDLQHRLNVFLPKDIAIQNIFEVDDDVHARFTATARTYHYYIATQKDPFYEPYTYLIPNKKLDIEAMNQACQILFEYEDFTSFSKLHTDVKTNHCQIYKAQWAWIDGRLRFCFSANRFLRNMVRAVVGTMLEVGLGKIKPEALHQIIQEKNRSAAGISVPAKALFLVEVAYPEGIIPKP